MYQPFRRCVRVCGDFLKSEMIFIFTTLLDLHSELFRKTFTKFVHKLEVCLYLQEPYTIDSLHSILR